MKLIASLLLALLASAAVADVTGPVTGTLPTNVVAPSTGQCLTFNGTVWDNEACGGSGGVTASSTTTFTNKSISGSTNTLTSLPAAALTGTVPAAALPNPSASTLGGTQSITCGSHTWISVISISGVPSCTQPASTDISGLGTSATVNTGTSGATIPLLNGTNTWAAAQTYSGANVMGTPASINLSNATSLPCAAMPALTGNVTSSAAGCATTIPAATVTLAMQANLAANSIEGNNTGSPAAPIALTVAQVKTMVGITTGSFTATGTGSASPGTATGVAITGTAGQFSCTCSGVAVGQAMAISGTFGGTGSITGYANPTTYYVSATNGTSTFTLQTLSQGAIVTTSGTPTGLTYTLGVAGTINYSINGNQVTLTAYAAITGTSSSTSMTLTNLPAAVQPVHAKDIIMFGLEDAGNPAFIGGGAIAAGGSVITFYMGVVSGTQIGGSATGFTASGTKGIPAGWSITYTND